jgi:hypothetical protein
MRRFPYCANVTRRPFSFLMAWVEKETGGRRQEGGRVGREDGEQRKLIKREKTREKERDREREGERKRERDVYRKCVQGDLVYRLEGRR